MATILAFRPQTRGAPDARRSSAAEVVFFPGVRYERWDDEPPRPQTPGITTKPRDRIGSSDD